MIIFKRRLLFWLVRAYIKRWGKFILISFFVGLGFFFILKQFLFTTFVSIMSQNKETIGVVGSYTLTSLPSNIVNNLSLGLTSIGSDDVPQPGLASSWKISNDGKTYQLTLKKHIFFTDATPLTSKEINLSYSDVSAEKPDPFTIIFHLKESYAPFLTTIARPVFIKNFVGTGPYILTSLTLNGSFVQSLSLRTKDASSTHFYQFYPTQDALKIAYYLGEVSTATNLSDISFQKTNFDRFPNTTISKTIRHDLLVTLFSNTQDTTLSDKKIRDAMSYLIPSSFSQGERAYSSISPLSWAYSSTNQHTEDPAHAGVLLDGAGGAKNL